MSLLRKPILLLLLAVAVVLAFRFPAAAQPAERPTTGTLQLAPRLFSIGYLRRETSGHPSEEHLEALRTALGRDPQVREALAGLGFTGIGLFACDGPTEMVRRLSIREFDLAFTPANLYRQAAGYTPILKGRRPDDIYNAGDIALRRGIVFVSPRCEELYGQRDLPAAEVAEVLGRQRLAVVSAQSAAGFTAPLVELHARYGRRALQGGVIYFDSSEEVVKAVLAGLADVGACEERAFTQVLENPRLFPRRGELAWPLFRTNPVVTDPVVVRTTLSPRHSALGRLLRLRIRTLSLSGVTGDIQYLNASDEDYGKLIELFREFDAKVGEGL